MAYSNVTPPPLPEYDTEIYGFYILVFSYEIGAEDWYSVQLRYAPWRFSYDEALGITNGGNNFLQVYGDGTWGDWGQNQETLAIKPGQVGKTYQRIYTNHNIFDANDEIYMAADTILPPDENRFLIKDFLNGLVMALCGRPIRWPSREPVAYLYGPDKVRLPDIFSVYTPDLQAKYPHACLIYSKATDQYILYATPVPGYVYWALLRESVSMGSGLPQYLAARTPEGSTSEWIDRSPEYTDPEATGGYPVNFYAESFVWSNHDIYYPDEYSHDPTLAGTLKFAASDPVPVYE